LWGGGRRNSAKIGPPGARKGRKHCNLRETNPSQRGSVEDLGGKNKDLRGVAGGPYFGGHGGAGGIKKRTRQRRLEEKGSPEKGVNRVPLSSPGGKLIMAICTHQQGGGLGEKRGKQRAGLKPGLKREGGAYSGKKSVGQKGAIVNSLFWLFLGEKSTNKQGFTKEREF